MSRRLVFVFMVVLWTFVMVACGNTDNEDVGSSTDEGSDSSDTENSNSDEELPLSGEHFVIGVNAEAAPYESIDTEGNFEGFDIEFADALSKKLGFTYEWNDMEFFGLIGAVQEGQVDMVISAISGTEERKKRVDFSRGYSELIMTIISKPDSGIESVDDFPGKKIGAVIGSNFEALIKEVQGAELVTYDVTVPAVPIIGTPELDALIEMSTFYDNYAAPTGLEGHVIPKEVAEELAGTRPLSIAFAKGSELVPIFNEAITELEEEGVLEELSAEWLGQGYVDKLPAYYGE